MRPSVGMCGILAAPDHEELAFDFACAGHGVVLHALAEAALVDVGCVEADGAVDIWDSWLRGRLDGRPCRCP